MCQVVIEVARGDEACHIGIEKGRRPRLERSTNSLLGQTAAGRPRRPLGHDIEQ